MSGPLSMPLGSAAHVAPAPTATTHEAAPGAHDPSGGFASLLRGGDAALAEQEKAPSGAAAKRPSPGKAGALAHLDPALAGAFGPSSGESALPKDADTAQAAATDSKDAGSALGVPDPRADEDRDRRTFSYDQTPAFVPGFVPAPALALPPLVLPTLTSSTAPRAGAPGVPVGAQPTALPGATPNDWLDAGALPTGAGESFVARSEGSTIADAGPGKEQDPTAGQAVAPPPGETTESLATSPAAAPALLPLPVASSSTPGLPAATPPPPSPPVPTTNPPALAPSSAATSGVPSGNPARATTPRGSPGLVPAPASAPRPPVAQTQATAPGAARASGADASASTPAAQDASGASAQLTQAIRGTLQASPAARAVTSSTGGAGRSRARGAVTDGTDVKDADETSSPGEPATTSTTSTLAAGASALMSPGTADDGRAKTVTVVTKASPATEASLSTAGERLRDALVSVANHAVLRGPATGHIDVPELGRVAVRAHSAGGAVDVEVTADRADARAILRGHVGEMTADLHQAAVPVARLTVDRGSVASGNSQGSASRDHNAAPNDSQRERQAPVDREDDPTTSRTTTPKRVRIVL